MERSASFFGEMHHQVSFSSAAQRKASSSLAASKNEEKKEEEAEDDDEECAVCMESLKQGGVEKLVCGHRFHKECVEGIRSFGVNQTCPLCREALPPGPEQQYERAVRQFCLIEQRQRRLTERLPGQKKYSTSSSSTLSAEDLQELAAVRKTWRELAEQGGHAVAYGALALLYEQGRGGVPRDELEAARLYLKGATLNDSLCQCNLANMYMDGRGGLVRSTAKAAELYKAASNQGDRDATFNLAVLLDSSDSKEAARLYRRAAEAGDRELPRESLQLV